MFSNREVSSYWRDLTAYNYSYFICYIDYLTDVVHAYKNLLREKDALEASVNVLTTSSNHAPKSLQKEAAESEADNHTGGNGRNESKKTNKEEGAKNPLKGESVEGKEVLDHPLAVKENEVEGEDQSQLAGKVAV